MKGAIIGNEFISEKKNEVYNPSTGEILDFVPALEREDVKRAIDLADSVYPKYSAIPAYTRKKLLIKTAELIRNSVNDLATIMSSEMGRPIKSSRAEIERTAQIFEYCAWELSHVLTGDFVPLEVYEAPAGNENRIAMVAREPMGVVASITPFNFPGASFAHKVATALAVGNTVVHKPTKNAPLTQLEIARLMLRAGFPQGSINVVTGNSQMIGDEFATNEKVRLITFTGSSNVGLELASRAMKRGIRSIMELGGSDAQIILDDADLPSAIEKATFGRYDYAGQFCNSTKRLIVSESVEQIVEKEIVGRLNKMRIGTATNESSDIGPLISKEAVSTMQKFVENAKETGSEVVFQSEVPKKGFFFPPTLIRVLDRKPRIVSEEVFGPILPIQTVKSDNEAVELLNSSRYGLNSSIFSKDFSRAYKIARKLRVGTVIINDTTRLRWDQLPFGGPKLSGIGRESISNTMMEMTEPKVIAYRLE
ncbi:MAG: aldehyde dehydrogenase [Thermoplasmatales archaeon B_DKE]|nr:MAG: aldehyde dehydrogenase [Thermoplasmatales archaeon B_DKE]